MSLQRTLDAIATRLERASSVPMTASCVVNRGELLSLVERARAEVPGSLDEANGVIAHRDELLDQAQRQALELVDSARQQAGRLVGTHAIVTVAQRRADQILDAARAEAARLLRQADEYCDAKLADLETDLDAALGQVRRGRKRLAERSGETPEPAADESVPAPPPQRTVVDVTELEREPAVAE